MQMIVGGTTSSSAPRQRRTRLPTFDGLYRGVVGTAGILFAEIPLLVVRARVIAESSGFRRPLPVVFYIWLIKDCVFIVIAMVTLAFYLVHVRRRTAGTSCNACGRAAFDNPDVFFAPEKRDTYIAQQQGLTGPGARRDAGLTGPGARRDAGLGTSVAHGESHALMDEPKLKSVPDGGTKSKKSVTFRLDLNEGCSSNGSDVGGPRTDCIDSDSDIDSDSGDEEHDSAV